ncbi:hypothetical protein EET67_22900 [Pseudaminobacter arsenicus]|uniref:Uncharacterized protein n=1 Tax=Borborobacter arsenicus TaxID=1851146 RepID=A0A432V002_9HYPH|nr:hypothetical protein [Pseudaminobacter arsenicus]RUM95503.1 hypothetical protein EET67_22900 [Pseudaminobacter arsenicus]
MHTFLRSQARRQGGYTPEELSMLDQVCKTAVSRLGLISRDEINDLAAGVLSLYDMGSDDPEDILRDIMLVFSTGRRLKRRGMAGLPGVASGAGKTLPKPPAVGPSGR